jgi:hypothetical protein
MDARRIVAPLWITTCRIGVTGPHPPRAGVFIRFPSSCRLQALVVLRSSKLAPRRVHRLAGVGDAAAFASRLTRRARSNAAPHRSGQLAKIHRSTQSQQLQSLASRCRRSNKSAPADRFEHVATAPADGGFASDLSASMLQLNSRRRRRSGSIWRPVGRFCLERGPVKRGELGSSRRTARGDWTTFFTGAGELMRAIPPPSARLEIAARPS